ncbi:MAG TPA: Hsp20/alpha crystallin family protein [Phycisphaerales bacterium]|nr:Hsp20/alpha crystallin family protein [Phycisphaerales bacterium]
MIRSITNRPTNSPAARQPAPFTPLSRMMDEFFGTDPFFALTPVSFTALNREQSTGMALDFGEDQNSYIVRASLPGFAESDITCEVNEGVLTIKAEKAEEQEDTDKTWHRRERRWGSVMRQVQLPAPVVEDQAQAELVNGVLTLRLPKVQKAPARRISINSGKAEASEPTQTGRQNAHVTNGHTPSEPRSRMAGASR